MVDRGGEARKVAHARWWLRPVAAWAWCHGVALGGVPVQGLSLFLVDSAAWSLSGSDFERLNAG